MRERSRAALSRARTDARRAAHRAHLEKRNVPANVILAFELSLSANASERPRSSQLRTHFEGDERGAASVKACAASVEGRSRAHQIWLAHQGPDPTGQTLADREGLNHAALQYVGAGNVSADIVHHQQSLGSEVLRQWDFAISHAVCASDRWLQLGQAWERAAVTASSRKSASEVTAAKHYAVNAFEQATGSARTAVRRIHELARHTVARGQPGISELSDTFRARTSRAAGETYGALMARAEATDATSRSRASELSRELRTQARARELRLACVRGSRKPAHAYRAHHAPPEPPKRRSLSGHMLGAIARTWRSMTKRQTG